MKSFLLSDYKEKLKKKFEYDEDFAEEIAIMASSLADFYGGAYEDVVYDALLNCKVVKATTRENSVIRENVSDVFKRENFNSSIKVDILKNLDRGYFMEPSIESENGTFKLVGVNRIIVLPGYFNSSNPESLGILAKACIELVKSSISSYSIKDNVLTTKTGYVTTKEKLENTSYGIIRSYISSKGLTLYNGMNCYDQLCLIREMYDSSYDVHGDDYTRILSGVILENLGIKDELRLYEIAHSSQLKNVFKEHFGISFDEFLNITDSLSHLEYDRKSSFMDEEKLKLALSKLDSQFNEIATKMRSLGNTYETNEKTI